MAGGQGALEDVELTGFGGAYAGRRVLVTGHTGFKGSWLALWLTRLGARVTGLALDPPSRTNHWDLLRLPIAQTRTDVRDAAEIVRAVRDAEPEIVFHLAAQSLVRRSYAAPVETWDVNVTGTLNVLEACRGQRPLRAIVVAASDKCYRNRESSTGYRETDPLGGHDPYSASKAATEILVESHRRSFFSSHAGPALASVRAGNVIGGGDWADDRLVPDLARAVAAGEPLVIRSPDAIRPWQHVLDCLSGYLRLGQCLLRDGHAFAEAWNFGPDASDERSVRQLLDAAAASWPAVAWQTTSAPQPHETHVLRLDSGKARERLAWRPTWSLDQALGETLAWYQAFLAQKPLASDDQLLRYVAAARSRGMAWAD